MTVRALLGLALSVAHPPVAHIPLQAPNHVVQGLVFDSVAGAPLAGAVVHVAARDLLGRPFTVTTDSTGRYRFSGLPSGRFLIDFEHDALSALGLESTLWEFVLATDTLVTIDLGVPSSAVVRALKCGTGRGGGATTSPDGMLAGFVRDAGGDHALGQATVSVTWNAIVLDSGDFRTVVQRARATTDAEGTYRLCGLPLDASLDVQVAAPGTRSIVGHVLVPSEGVARQDFRLADSSLARGGASIRGRVVRVDGKPLASGRAIIRPLARSVPVNDGIFVLTDLPLGSWFVEVRAVGFEPRTTLIDATEGGSGATMITLDDRTQHLDAVTVVGKPSRDSRILDEVQRRQRSSFGTVFLPGSVWLQDALHPADVLRAARGFIYKSPTEIYGRRVASGLCTSVAVYMNGAYLPGGLEALDDMVSIREVLAIEAYPDIAFAPVEWRTNHRVAELRGTIGKIPRSTEPPPVCAVVVVWTRQ